MFYLFCVITPLKNAILSAFAVDPHLSTRARFFAVPQYYIHRILKKNRLFAYKMQIPQELSGNDKARCLAFCQVELAQIAADPGHLQFLMFSVEAIFHLDGQVNEHDFWYWSKKNPIGTRRKVFIHQRLQYGAGFGREGIIGPFFFENSVTVKSYL